MENWVLRTHVLLGATVTRVYLMFSPDERHAKLKVGVVPLRLRDDVVQLVLCLVDPALHLRGRKRRNRQMVDWME